MGRADGTGGEQLIMEYQRKTTTRFARLMRHELATNDHKGDWAGWKPSIFELESELRHHLRKLTEAMLNHDRSKVTEHAADVANYCMKAEELFGTGGDLARFQKRKPQERLKWLLDNCKVLEGWPRDSHDQHDFLSNLFRQMQSAGLFSRNTNRCDTGLRRLVQRALAVLDDENK